jgi:hypothetical protein
MEFIIGGYYLIQATESKAWMNEKFFPPMIWSASHHICEIYPQSWIFTWTSDDVSAKERKRNQEILELDDDAFHSLQLEFDNLFNQDEFGFPNVFFSLVLARNFYRRYLKHLSNIKLLSIALPDEYWEQFIQETVPGKNMGENGIRIKLRARHSVEPEAMFKGFEVLGYDNSQFCSYICNSLEDDYSKKLSISLNKNGFIENYDDARKAAQYTMLDETQAEPYLWFPWLISEYSIE